MTTKIDGSPAEGTQFIMDSEATHHMCHNEELFRSSVLYNNQLSLRHDSILHSRLIGTINAIISNDKSQETKWIRLIKVLYVPNLGIKLILVNALDRFEVMTLFKKGTCKFSMAELKYH